MNTGPRDMTRKLVNDLVWCRWCCLCLALAIVSGTSATAQTITVTICLDIVDVPGNATIDDLPGPDGQVSMNEALTASDNTPGIQTIGFAIPESEWWLSDIYPGQVLLQSTFGWSAQQPVIIDGTTQTDFTGDTFPGGHEMSLDGLGLGLNGDDSELFGFHGCHVGLGGNNSVIHDNTGAMRISVGPFNSGNIVRDNEADTIELTYSDNNVVIRNVAERVRITGQGNFGPPASGNRIGGPDPADRNFLTGWGNVGEHGVPSGDTVELFYTDNTLIENNYIGTTPDGMEIGNHASTVGVGVYNKNHNLTVRNNLIAIQSHHGGGNTGPAGGTPILLNMYEGGNNIRILGNTLGLDALGAPSLGGGHGIIVSRYAFQFGADVQIGGPNPGEGNIIAGHEGVGVLMEIAPGVPATGYIRLSGNSIYGNDDIGIDLMPNTWDFGPTANDPLDADSGANDLQNFPEIFQATSNGTSVQVNGQLHTEPLNDYTIEFFASEICDDSGFGEGQMFLGGISVSTDAGGNTTFDVSLAANVPDGWFITATATREPVGATSEFSACIAIETTILLGDVNLDGAVNLLDVDPFIERLSTGSYQAEADINQDGTVDLLDVGPFVQLLGG